MKAGERYGEGGIENKGGRMTRRVRGQLLVNGGYFGVRKCYYGVTVVSGVEVWWKGIRGAERVVDH